MNEILNAIQSISDEARRALADPEMSRESLLFALSVSVRSSVTLMSVSFMGFDQGID